MGVKQAGSYEAEHYIYSEQSVLFFVVQDIFVGLVFLIMSVENFIIHDPLCSLLPPCSHYHPQFLRGPITRCTLAKPCLK